MRIELHNWKNFLAVNVPLEQRVFLVGPNAVGKSNFLDAFRFLRDIASPEGGLRRAVQEPRGGVSLVRSLYARRYPNVVVDADLDIDGDLWGYRIEFTQDNQKRPVVSKEVVRKNGDIVRQRPGDADAADSDQLLQTHLEQVNVNKEFRVLQEALAKTQYLHIVPQIVRDPKRYQGGPEDPFGGDFLEQLARTPAKTLDSRLKRITDALRVAVPQLTSLILERDAGGRPHLKGLYEHWRPKAGWQNETQLSDGTLRLLGLLWKLLDGSAPLLLEEPELSLHPAVVRHIPAMMARVTRRSGRQILVSTHSADLLADEGIAPEEVLLLTPSSEETHVTLASSDAEIVALLEGGAAMADAVLPRTAPPQARQLALFAD
ncbi:MAG TPA: AAA family ATPase [Polyangia bacterium]|nr:AAA family ATPase [Polyangia bacterium]